MAEFYTQLLIWETINSFGGSFVGASSVSIPSTVGGMDNIASQSTYNAFKKAVMEKVNLFYTTPSIAGQTVTLKMGETVTLTDTTGVLSDYKDPPVVNTTGIQVTKSGNTVTLTATGTPNASGVVRFAYNVDRAFIDKGPGFYYEHDVEQDVVTCGFASRDPVAMTPQRQRRNERLLEDRQDLGGRQCRWRALQRHGQRREHHGADWLGRHDHHPEFAGRHCADRDGAHLRPIRAAAVADGYDQGQSDRDREFLKRPQKWTATVTKHDSSTGTAQGDASLAGAVYGVYRGNDLIDQYTTDANGQFTTKEYVCGDSWYIKEISPSPGYQLDGTRYPVGATPGKFTLEHNQVAVSVQEQVKLNKISITKYADMVNGDDVPEEGAVFEVYLKSAGSYDNAKASERDRITTNASGYAVTKDLPFGTYVLHQVAAAQAASSRRIRR